MIGKTFLRTSSLDLITLELIFFIILPNEYTSLCMLCETSPSGGRPINHHPSHFLAVTRDCAPQVTIDGYCLGGGIETYCIPDSELLRILYLNGDLEPLVCVLFCKFLSVPRSGSILLSMLFFASQNPQYMA